MIRFRMYLGTKDRFGADVPQTVQTAFFDTARQRLQGFTVYPALGVWRGEKEHTHVFEYFGDALERPKIDELAREYATVADQESVLVTSEHISEEEVSFVTQTQEVA